MPDKKDGSRPVAHCLFRWQHKSWASGHAANQEPLKLTRNIEVAAPEMWSGHVI